MSVVRTNPIPNGVYWLDVWGPVTASKRPDGRIPWTKWVGANFAKVVVLRSDEQEPDLAANLLRTFVVFRVVAPPSAFPFRELGFPETAPSDDVSSDDVVSKPPPEPLFDFSFLQTPAAGVLLLVGLYFFLKGNHR